MDNIIFAFCFVFLSLSLHISFVPSLIIPLWIYFFSFLVFEILSRSLWDWELKRVEVEGWTPGGQDWGHLWHLSQRNSRQKGEGREESKSQSERGSDFCFALFFLVETELQDSVSNREHIPSPLE
jgi:hypothetical protein